MESNLNFEDILKKSVLKGEYFTGASIVQIFVGLTISLILGIFIFLIYKKNFRGVVYSFNFNLSLLLLCMITSLIIMTISSNIVLSLGMVGALSIVRFRTAIKDPLDIIYAFWSISTGITAGAGIYSLAFLGSIFIGVCVIVFCKIKIKDKAYMLIIHYNSEANNNVKKVLSNLKHVLKSKTVNNGIIELTVEVRLLIENTSFVNEISDIDGVENAVLVNYAGDYAS